MNWSLADSMAAAVPLRGGGTCEDIAQVVFAGRSLPPIKARIHQYVATMRSLRKPVECVRVSDDDYTKLVRGVAKIKGLKESEICGLKHDGIPVIAQAG
jgi:hypothetical protein